MSTKKGITLPINLIVILAVAVIVLVTLMAFYFGLFPRPELTKMQKFRSCCSMYINAYPTCEKAPAQFTCKGIKGPQGNVLSLTTAASKAGVTGGAKKIKKACGCPIT